MPTLKKLYARQKVKQIARRVATVKKGIYFPQYACRQIPGINAISMRTKGEVFQTGRFLYIMESTNGR